MLILNIILLAYFVPAVISILLLKIYKEREAYMALFPILNWILMLGLVFKPVKDLFVSIPEWYEKLAEIINDWISG